VDYWALKEMTMSPDDFIHISDLRDLTTRKYKVLNCETCESLAPVVKPAPIFVDENYDESEQTDEEEDSDIPHQFNKQGRIQSVKTIASGYY